MDKLPVGHKDCDYKWHSFNRFFFWVFLPYEFYREALGFTPSVWRRLKGIFL
jgi:hypothetical protein